MLTVWQSTLSGVKAIADYVKRQFTFASGTPLEEVSNTLGSLNGNATIAGNKLVLGSGYSYMAWPNLTFGVNEDFTYEAWVNITSLPIGQAGIMSTWNNGGQGNNGYLLYVISGIVQFYFTTADQSTTVTVNGPSISLGVPHHVAVSRTNGVIRVFVDGVSGAPVTNQVGCFVSTLPVRTAWSNPSTSFIGSIWNIRQTKNMSLYTANFTPPTTL